jgi:uncharacterized protein (TIGR02996 family)
VWAVEQGHARKALELAMREEAILLKAIADGDDTARLAYADWLDERGDPRAAWARNLQVWRWMAPDAHDPIPGLIEALRGDDWPRRQNACAALSVVAAPAVPALLGLLSDSGNAPEPAWQAGGALAKMPRDAVEPILPALFDLAASDDDWIRGPAINALEAVGDAALPALPSLIAALDTTGQERQPVLEAAAVVLRNIGPPASSAIQDLLVVGSYEYEIRDTIESALAAIAARSIADLLQCIANIEEDDRRLWAANVLRAMGPDIVPQLQEAVAKKGSPDGNWEATLVREVAAVALAPHDPRAALPALLDGLEACAGDEREADYHFAEALRDMGPEAAPAVDKMRELLPLLGWSAGKAITDALAKLGEAESARESLFRQLEHRDEGERASALSAMVHLDEIPEHLLGAVVACLDREGSPRYDAQSILKRMTEGPQRRLAWPRLLALAGHPQQDVAVWAIESLAAHPEEAEGTLRSCLRDERAALRVAALEALAGVNGFTDEFLRLSRDRDPRVRQAAAYRLGDTGPMSPAIASAVRNLLRSRVIDVRDAAMRAVAIRGPIECGAASIVARLARRDPSERIRERAIDCIPECGLSPAQAVALLRRCLTEDAEVGPRRAAAFSLGVVAEQPGGRAAALAALPELIARLAEDEAVHAIARIGPDAVPHLVAALRKHPAAGACKALGLIGEAGQTLTALIDALSSPARETREEAARALAAIGRPARAGGACSLPSAVPALRRMLWADTEGQVEAAITALAGIGATAAFNDLARMAQGEQQPALALWAAARLGDASIQLYQALDSPNEEVRAIAVIERARLGAGPPPSIDDLFAVSCVPALRHWLLDELARRDDAALLPAAAKASRSGGHPLHSLGMEILERFGNRDPEAAVEALDSAYQCHAEIVLRGLGRFGFGSRRAYVAILRRMGSYQPAVRAAGIAALRRFLPASPPAS